MIAEDDVASFTNYINDAWIRSLDCRDWALRFESNTISHGWSNQQIKDFQELYNQIIHFLMANVRIGSPKGFHLSEMISFHSRFGWIAESKSENLKAYLGKISILDKTLIQIGRQSYISGHSTIRGKHTLKIGSFTAIAEGLYLNTTPDLHPTEYASIINFSTESRCIDDGLHMDISFGQLEDQASGITIGNDVWIGRDVRIFHGVEISTGTIVAERALVRGKTEPYGIYAGVPAKLKKFRFSDSVISELLDIQWWNWPVDRLLRNKLFFSTNLKKVNGSVWNLIKE